jgi:hypothetical protein
MRRAGGSGWTLGRLLEAIRAAVNEGRPTGERSGVLVLPLPSERGAAVLRASAYIPSGWRTTYPPVDSIELDQRVPVSCSAIVSKRLPSITMKAWPAFA